MDILFADQEDKIHGKFRSVEVKQPDGTIRQMEVSEKWLLTKKLKKEMASAPEDWIQANFIGPRGDRIEILKIGKDVDRDTVSEFRDHDTGQLYGMYAFSAGEEEVNLIQKAMYDEVKRQMVEMQPFIDEEVRRSIHGEDKSRR